MQNDSTTVRIPPPLRLAGAAMLFYSGGWYFGKHDMIDRESGRDHPALWAMPRAVRWLLFIMAVPFALVLVVAANAYGLVQRIGEMPLRRFTYNGLARPEHRHRATWREVRHTQTEQRLAEAEALVSELIEDADWLSLAELVQEWDQSNAYAGAGHGLALNGLDAMTAAFADGYFAPNFCTPIAIPAIRDDAFDIVTQLREGHPEVPFIAIFEAHLHLMKAWENRGTREARHVTEAGWDDAIRRVKASKWVVAPLLEQGYNSALMAKLRIGWLAFGCDGVAEFRQPFDAYRSADPRSSVPDEWMGNFLLDRWYGDGDFDSELRAECERLGARGAEAYVHAYLGQMDVGDELLPWIDGAYFAQGVVQLGERYAGDLYALNSLLEQAMRIAIHEDRPQFGKEDKAAYQTMVDQIYEGCAEVLRTHVTAIHPEIFPDPAPMLDLMADAAPEAFAAGHHFSLDEQGLRTWPADQA